MNRKGKLLRNLVLILLALTGVWFLVGRPLPLRLEYRRAEQAHFMEEKEILLILRPEKRVLSQDEENLYLFQLKGYFVGDRSIQTFPLKDGFGCAMAVQSDLVVPLDFYAYDASEKAVRAELRYTITPEGQTGPEFVYVIDASGDQGLFHFCLTLEPTETGGYSGREQDYVTDIYETWQGYRVHSAWEQTVTFYDAQGGIVGQLTEQGNGEGGT